MLNHPDPIKLINLSSQYDSSFNLAEKLSLFRYLSVRKSYPFDSVRINPFGFKTSDMPHISSGSKGGLFFRKGSGNLKSDLPKTLTEKRYTIESVLKSVLSLSNQNLIFDDITDNFFYSVFIADLFIRKVDDHIELLPYMNDSWPYGSLYNAVIDNFVFNLDWSGSKLKKGTVTALETQQCRISFKGKYIAVCDEEGNDVKTDFNNGIISFMIPKDTTYTIF